MKQKPQPLSKHDLLPWHWSIKRRLVSASVILGVLTIATPLYQLRSLSIIKSLHEEANQTWWISSKSHEFNQLITESEHLWELNYKNPQKNLLPKIRSLTEPLREIITQLKTSVSDDPTQWTLVSEIDVLFEHWLKIHLDNPSSASDPEVFLFITKKLGQLQRELHSKSNTVNQESLRSSSGAFEVVTYNGLFFFFGFLLLMLSLWRSLIPGLTALLLAAREFRRGNLDHRVHLPGHDETARLGYAFNEMAISVKAQNEKLKELNRLKTDFVSTVSHELRTPLTAIKGSIGLILGGVTGEMPDETKDMLKITHKNTDRLIRLINDVLDISKIEAGAIQMKFDKFSLADVVGHAVAGLESLANTNGLKIIWKRPDPSPLVVLDRDRIEQVVTNLLSNAIKFTEPGGKITVRIDWEAERVVIHVEDNGAGIPEESLERIFEKFQQVESIDRKNKEGSGLGLTIAKAIINEHGGAIWVSSRKGVGSDFAFSLPWNGKDYVDAKRNPTGNPKPQKTQTILVVDDEREFLMAIKHFLEHEGYKVISCDSGAACIDLAVKHRPDLIVLDVIMPGINGLAAQTLLAKNVGTEKIPIAFLTTTNENKEILQAESNVVRVFNKPIVNEDLKLWLENFFSQKKAA